MNVLLREMPVHRSVRLPVDELRDCVGDLPQRLALEPKADDVPGELRAELDFEIDDETVLVRGKIAGWVEVACSRCLNPTRIDLTDDVIVMFLPSAQVPEMNDTEVSAEELFSEDDSNVFPYEGESIDLAPMMREHVVLGIPYAPLCQESCAGLCLACGADLNGKNCTCDRNAVDPRLAALKDLKV